ncbi:protein HYPER-SENSITIVITY-RELATED 4-like [Elaeis guineensis]|uniref:Protein HYPER-SENSITIVITY-RELATED 4-like n=1 Tax=Elaeis guineensis var. tenera TaxID=51953 RepID=A0A6I9SBT8_ELAGV|nr:protein HYPER-SENSITIVITY-RELATED 4-like [Elaeis guineensis]
MATTCTVLSTAILDATSAVVQVIPEHIRHYLLSTLTSPLDRLFSQHTIVIDELDGITVNMMYRSAKIYLGTKLSPATRRYRVTKRDDSAALDVTMERGGDVVDVFEEVHFRWRLLSRDANCPRFHTHRRGHYFYDSHPSEVRYFELTFHRKHKNLALHSYLPHVLDQSKTIKEQSKTLKLYTNHGNMWSPVNLHHPATFDTLAMDDQLKKKVMDDLARFVKRKEFYKRTGKAWKRGYLLHGPPGTGKTSLIAAMANHLKFDVYDLEMTEVRNNSTLRSLLVGTANRSILVVEDIDWLIDLWNRDGEKKAVKETKNSNDEIEKVTFSGLLNLVDGLWSSFGEERIVVFTTNDKDRLEPALLRPGRLDVHIPMGYCTPSAFRVLASNHHRLHNHPLFEEIEALIEEVDVTPAEVAGELMNSDEAEVALRGLIKLIKTKKKQVGAPRIKKRKR